MKTQTFIPDSRYPNCTLTAYLHEQSDEMVIPARRAIIICPGGGYEILSDHEGEPVALQFFAAGLNAFVIKHSLKDAAAHDVPLIEGALAIQHLRENADVYGIDPNYIFICGFSAGGHFAAMAGTLWNDPIVREALGVDRGECSEGINRPTATVLCYPVITGGVYAHRGSIDVLCGYPSAGTPGADRYSLELHVDQRTSPAFIWHTANDEGVSIQNSICYVEALARAGVPFEYHVYPNGFHGLSLATEETACGQPQWVNPVCAGWLKEAIRFLKEFH